MTKAKATKPTHRKSRPGRRLLLAASLLCRPPLHAGPALAAAAAASSASAPPPGDGERRRTDRTGGAASSLLGRFESRGPTLALTLRDPSRAALDGDAGGGGGGRPRPWGRSGTGRGDAGGPAAAAAADDGAFGLSSKVAALFHISPTAADGPAPPPSRAASGSARGYLLDDGEIALDPPSEAPPSSLGGLFSARRLGDELSRGGWGRSLEECARNVHPEIRQEVRTREGGDGDDTRPFPELAPWLSGLSCGMIWSPFPLYKDAYPEGYGHKLLSAPHFVRCGATVSIPRLSAKLREWRSTSRGIARDFTRKDEGVPKTKDLDLGVTYRESPSRPGGAVELLLGRRSPSLPAHPPIDGVDGRPPAGERRRRNHLLVRFAAGRREEGNGAPCRAPSILSSIERVGASFRAPAPFLLRNGRSPGGGGLSVAPSLDVAGGTARCVVSGNVGPSGRTRAVLRLESEEESTLTLVRALDGSKIIAPTISLNSGKIVYDYHLNLDGVLGRRGSRGNVSSSLRAHVDPTDGILLKWTDGVRGTGRGGDGGGGGSCWVAECRIPLGTTAAGPLAADVRVGRRWVI